MFFSSLCKLRSGTLRAVLWVVSVLVCRAPYALGLGGHGIQLLLLGLGFLVLLEGEAVGPLLSLQDRFVQLLVGMSELGVLVLQPISIVVEELQRLRLPGTKLRVLFELFTLHELFDSFMHN